MKDARNRLATQQIPIHPLSESQEGRGRAGAQSQLTGSLLF